MIFLLDDEAVENKETYDEALERCLEDDVNIFFNYIELWRIKSSNIGIILCWSKKEKKRCWSRKEKKLKKMKNIYMN